jgi:LysM repeat protein
MPRSGWALLVAAVLLLAGCTATEPAPTVAPTAPPMLIVTATPGLPPASTQPRSEEQRYVVREGDSLSSIAERFDVTEAAIIRANNLADPDRILVGQELLIPPPEP